MKRAIIVGASTAAGLAAVLALNPDDPGVSASAALDGSAASLESGGSSTGSASGDAAGTAADSPSPDTTGSGTTDSGSTDSGSASSASGTFTGSQVQVRDWGIVQVEVTVSGGRITDVTALQAPDWDHRSAMISTHSIPELVSQALDAQSADIAGVSGATFTSRGFAQSLQSALARAGLG